MSETTAPAIEESPKSTTTSPSTQLRLWPGIVIVVALWLVRRWATMGEPAPSKFFFGLVVAPVALGALTIVWWLFASRLRWIDRISVPVMLVLTTFATVSVTGKDFPPMALILYVLPVLISIWIGWLIITIMLPWRPRISGLMALIILCGVVASTLRVEGMDGSFAAKFSWRWNPTAESKLLAELKSQPRATASTPEATPTVSLEAQPGDWIGFRGPNRDGRLNGVRVQANWVKSAPREIWRHRVGPGWSSCCVVGDHLFTQEQRGDQEFVVCYSTETGDEIWSHQDATRFEEVVAGAGPRGTPTFHDGRIYALGANGTLNCLNAMTGHVDWSVDIIKDTDAKIPQWGFSSSPLIFHNIVSVYAGGPNGKAVVAYDAVTGKLAWTAADGDKSYCSTQVATFDGVDQILIATEVGLFSLDPDSGAVLWQHKWLVEVARVVQPAVFNGTEVLLGTGMSIGTRRISVHRDGEQWSAKEVWTTKSIKPYYNDLVISGDHLYGFDGPIFMCVGLDDGKMKWRARGYDNGQVLLLVEDNLLLIVTEKGEVALVEATPEKHTERARFKAIEGKTWNHPVVAHGKLFVRNAEEIACFELPTTTEVTLNEQDLRRPR